MTGAESIALRGVRKRYGDVCAVDSVDLAVAPGTFHCLVGPNGSGKTTLLRLILGLTPPTAGEVSVPDVPLGAAFQQPANYADLTVGENLDVFASFAGGNGGWVERVVDRLGLDPVRGRRAGDLSGGYARKLDLALALCGEPAYLLLDEPLGDLDDVTKRRLVELLADYRDAGHAVLVSTHRLDRFAPHADRLTVVSEGRVLYDEPRAAFPEEDLHEFYVRTVLEGRV